jgi:hypothetical protein
MGGWGTIEKLKRQESFTKKEKQIQIAKERKKGSIMENHHKYKDYLNRWELFREHVSTQTLTHFRSV